MVPCTASGVGTEVASPPHAAKTTASASNIATVPHTTTATGGEWDSGTLGGGDRFSFTFTTAGSFDYVCAIHPRMTGTISVE